MTRAAQAVPSATCHCGSVRIRVRRAPRTVTRCNCSICRRYGALWAYYGASAVQIETPKGGLSSRGAARFAPSFAARYAVASRTTSTGRNGVGAASQSMPLTSRPRCSGSPRSRARWRLHMDLEILDMSARLRSGSCSARAGARIAVWALRLFTALRSRSP